MLLENEILKTLKVKVETNQALGQNDIIAMKLFLLGTLSEDQIKGNEPFEIKGLWNVKLSFIGNTLNTYLRNNKNTLLEDNNNEKLIYLFKLVNKLNESIKFIESPATLFIHVKNRILTFLFQNEELILDTKFEFEGHTYHLYFNGKQLATLTLIEKETNNNYFKDFDLTELNLF